MIQAIVAGLFQGATFGLVAVGLVLVYKGTRVFNFAQGEFGTLAAYVTWVLFAHHHVNYALAMVGGLVAAVAMGLLMERLIVRPLLSASRITLLVATVGVALAVIQTTIIIEKPITQVLSPAIKGKPIVILNAGIQLQQLLLVAALIVVGIALALFFRTDLGNAVLATSQDAMASRVVGISVPTVSRLIWGIAALLGGLAGILQAPVTVFEPGFMTTFTLLPAFTAAVIGGMDSLPGAFIGGEIVGVAQGVGAYYLGFKRGVPDAADLTVLLVLLIVLMARPRGILGKEVA